MGRSRRVTRVRHPIDDGWRVGRSGQIDHAFPLSASALTEVLEGLLGPNETSVGMRLQIDHVQPSAVGTTVGVDATLEKVEGRRLTFVVNARDSRGLIAAGRVTRVIVDRDRFMEKID